ncbi:hypothetical protein, partial [Sporolactobacillus terrae]|uniref:hypothetical protein n=1 Tax=Sporolactobacillus terrae TaxID=269673 RepID=UPI001F4521FD
VLNFQPCMMVSCLFGAESPLRLLACRGRTTSLLRQTKICGISLARCSRWRQSTSALTLGQDTGLLA